MDTGDDAKKVSLEETFKLVIVGDGMVGKTCILMRYALNAFPDQYVPTILETYAKPVKVDGVQVRNATIKKPFHEHPDLDPILYRLFQHDFTQNLVD